MLLPKQARGGRWVDHRAVLRVAVRPCSGDSDDGLIDRSLKRFHVSPDAAGRIDWSVFDVDGHSIRGHVSAG